MRIINSKADKDNITHRCHTPWISTASLTSEALERRRSGREEKSGEKICTQKVRGMATNDTIGIQSCLTKLIITNLSKLTSIER